MKKFQKIHNQVLGRKEFAAKVAERSGVEHTTAAAIFEAFLDQLMDELKAGNKIEFRGCFILGTKVQKSRVAQNPKTLEKVTIPQRRVAYFKKGDGLKNLPDLD